MKHDTAGPSGAEAKRAPEGTPRPSALVRTALVPVAAVAVTLFGLLLYASSGAAGSPPARIEIADGRVLAPTNPDHTSAYFTLRNTGESADTLLSVTSPQLGPVMIARTVVKDGAGRMTKADGIHLPPGGTYVMTPSSSDLMLPSASWLTAGRTVDFDLHFAGSGTSRARAAVVPLGR
ncbi:copper chaperone PCu(A)C [Streptomyces sp. NPDC008139]|uniref:copper chaperone PCu(A)C n=1 Tax=Streptomyces sp. NPDC008139 TaxID=3364814 RepID=UPI0036F0D7AF